MHFVDNPGFVIGTDAERAVTIRYGARALAAAYEAQLEASDDPDALRAEIERAPGARR